MSESDVSQQDTLRERALIRLKKRRAFTAHLLVYVMVNAFIVAIWALTSRGFFWPIFPMVGWGIGLVMNAWDVWRGDEFSEAAIDKEMRRMKRPT